MKTLILYATKSGAARECAELLAERVKGSVALPLSMQLPKIADYDTIIVGSGVRIGKMYKPARALMVKQLDILLTKRIAIFLCNAYPATQQTVIDKNIPQPLIEHAVCIESLGGKPPFKNPDNQDWVRWENMSALLQSLGAG
jgi:menaquinone-dependent protoporphyrinogen oxidase